ncbi:MAG: hypothetical protein RI861_03950, partial [Planktomarina sp.]|nr:hypothetical protein [Planktomarina sp.]
MTPEFLLKLAINSVSLEEKSNEVSHSAGWVELGHTDFDVENLKTALAQLTEKATFVGELPLEVYAALPNDQIKLISVSHKGLTRQDVLEALRGQTPYSPDELRFDWRDYADGSLIAAVAQETLGEADLFVRQNGFQAIGFVALPGGEWGDNFASFGVFDQENNISVRPSIPYIIAKERPNLEIQSAALPVITGNENAYQASVSKQQGISKQIILDPTQSKNYNNEIGTEAPNTPLSARPPQLTQIDDSPHKKPIIKNSDPTESTKFLEGSISSQPNEKSIFRLVARLFASKKDSDPKTIASSEAEWPEKKTRKPLIDFKNAFFTLAKVKLPKRLARPKQPKLSPGEDKLAPVETLQASVGGKPSFLGVTLTTILLLFMLTIAVLAATSGRDTIARWFNSSPQTTKSAVLPVPNVSTQETLPILGGNNQTPAVKQTSRPAVPRKIPPAQPKQSSNFQGVTSKNGSSVNQSPALPPADNDLQRKPNGGITELVQLSNSDKTSRLKAIAHFTKSGVWVLSPGPSLGDISTRSVNFVSNAPARHFFKPITAVLPNKKNMAATLLDTEQTKFLKYDPFKIDPVLPTGTIAFTNSDDKRLNQKNRPKIRPFAKAKLTTSDKKISNEILLVIPKVSPRSRSKAFQLANAPVGIVIGNSLRPITRPTAMELAATIEAAAAPPKIAQASEVQKPTAPTRSSVAQAATVEDVLKLRKINLIGIFGSKTAPSALVRLTNGRVLKVGLGELLDGGRVTAIGRSSLTYNKSGKSITLNMPIG